MSCVNLKVNFLSKMLFCLTGIRLLRIQSVMIKERICTIIGMAKCMTLLIILRRESPTIIKPAALSFKYVVESETHLQTPLSGWQTSLLLYSTLLSTA